MFREGSGCFWHKGPPCEQFVTLVSSTGARLHWGARELLKLMFLPEEDAAGFWACGLITFRWLGSVKGCSGSRRPYRLKHLSSECVRERKPWGIPGKLRSWGILHSPPISPPKRVWQETKGPPGVHASSILSSGYPGPRESLRGTKLPLRRWRHGTAISLTQDLTA